MSGAGRPTWAWDVLRRGSPGKLGWVKTSPPLVGRLARFWRRHYFSRCCSEAAHSYPSVSCTRRRGHERYDPVHFNVVFEVAWREGEQVPYPTDALRRAGVDGVGGLR